MTFLSKETKIHKYPSVIRKGPGTLYCAYLGWDLFCHSEPRRVVYAILYGKQNKFVP